MEAGYGNGPPRPGTSASRVILVDVEGCLRVNGTFDPRLADALDRWLAVASLNGQIVEIVVWSADRMAAREGAAWLQARSGRTVPALLKSSDTVPALTADHLVIDDDEALRQLAEVFGATTFAPHDFIALSNAESARGCALAGHE